MYYIFPLFTGRMYSEKWASIQFILMMWGTVQVFFTQHILGLEGMARRIYDYPAEFTTWTQLNQIATVGAWILGASFVMFLAQLIYYSAKGKEANMADPFNLGGKYYYPYQANTTHQFLGHPHEG
jgi:cytochrome c oxidase subunit 1